MTIILIILALVVGGVIGFLLRGNKAGQAVASDVAVLRTKFAQVEAAARAAMERMGKS